MPVSHFMSAPKISFEEEEGIFMLLIPIGWIE
jgi:hypothetical protein